MMLDMEITTDKVLADIEAENKKITQLAILTTIAFVGLLSGVLFQWFEASIWWVSTAYLLTYLSGGGPAIIKAIETLKRKSVDINFLMIIAALAAAGVGEVRDGAILLFLFSFAGTLEGYAMANTKKAIVALMKLRPEEANKLKEDGSTVRVKVEVLMVGEKIIVRPGERLPVDGRIESGSGAIDQSSLTGESMPVDKNIGDTVFAGTINQNSILTVVVTKTVAESTIARMIELVTEAQAQKSPSERFSDWFGERYTIVVLVGCLLMLGVFLGLGMTTTQAFYKTATLLVVASPCAIVISVPAAVLSAIAAAAKSGVLFKGGVAIEEFGLIDTVAFDKTGTLTEGKMHVHKVVSVSELQPDEVLAIVTALETHSEHPIAHSIRQYANNLNLASLEINHVEAMPGKGIKGRSVDGVLYWAGNQSLMSEQGIEPSENLKAIMNDLEVGGQTTVLVGSETEVLGMVAVSDQVRSMSERALVRLKNQGIERFVMLTGDAEVVAQAVGRKLNIPEQDVFAALLPDDKVKHVKKLNQEGRVAFVGDGINDAAALAMADVGVAMGMNGSDVAIEAADVTLLSDDLGKLAEAHTLAKATNRIIKQNLFFASGIMMLMVGVTIFSHLPLPLGVIGHEGGTLLVVANGLRLLFVKRFD